MVKRQGIMLPYWWDATRFQKKFPTPSIVQPKINGNRCRAYGELDEDLLVTTLLSSSATKITSVPHLEEIWHSKWTPEIPEIDGEIYHHGWPHEIINGLVRTTTSVPEAGKELEYWVFDIINNNPQQARLERLNSLDLFPFVTVEYFLVSSIDEMEERYYEFCEQGFEGIIIRHPYEPYHRKKTTTMMKLKPREIGYFEILGVVEEVSIHGEKKGQAGALICQTMDGERFSVSGMTQKARKALWEIRDFVAGHIAKIKYQNLSHSRQVPLMPSFLGLFDPEKGE